MPYPNFQGGIGAYDQLLAQNSIAQANAAGNTGRVPMTGGSMPLYARIGGGGGGGGATGYSGMSSVYPQLAGTQTEASDVILNQLKGQLSPGTLAALQNHGARLGVSGLGMPGSDMANRNSLALIGRTAEGQANQGLQNFLNTLKGYSGTVTPTTGELISQELGHANIGAENARSSSALSENARQFDIAHWLQNQQFYAGLGPQYLNAMGSYLNFLG